MIAILGVSLRAALFIIVTCLYSVFNTVSAKGNIEGQAREVFSKLYGNASLENYIVFLHGGPGYNSVTFEITNANRLSSHGALLIYDRRSSGRSPKGDANDYTFRSSISGLEEVLKRNGYDKNKHKLTLIGHSFGATIALRALESERFRVDNAIFVSMPISYANALRNIISRCQEVYKDRKDSQNLKYIEMLKGMDRESIQYVQYVQQHAFGCGLYNPPVVTEESKRMHRLIQESKNFSWVTHSQHNAFQGYFIKEKFHLIEDYERLKKMSSSNKIHFIYGEHDFTLSSKDKSFLNKEFKGNVSWFSASSHTPFIDQEQLFFQTVGNIINGKIND